MATFGSFIDNKLIELGTMHASGYILTEWLKEYQTKHIEKHESNEFESKEDVPIDPDAPTEIKYNNGKIYIKLWKNEKGELHRENGPALIRYNMNKLDNDLNRIQYYKNNKLHREDGPAHIEYCYYDKTNTKIHSEQYYKHGELHREDGPAYIIYDKYTKDCISKSCEMYYLNGKIRDETQGAGRFDYYASSSRPLSGKLKIKTFYDDSGIKIAEIHYKYKFFNKVLPKNTP